MQKPSVDTPMVTIKSEIKTEIVQSSEEPDQPSVTLQPPQPTPTRVKKRKKSLTEELFNPDVKRKTKPLAAARAVQNKSFDLEAADIPVYIPTPINPVEDPGEDVSLSPVTESSWKCNRCDYVYVDNLQLRLVNLIDYMKVKLSEIVKLFHFVL